VEGEALLDRILENTPRLEPLRVEPELSHEEASSAEAKPVPSIERPSHEPEDPEEGFQPLDLPYFKDELFKDELFKFSEIPQITHVRRGHRSLSILANLA
jgi:hypothetical protein